MRKLILAACIVCIAGVSAAADSPAMKTYIHMKQDSDIFLGEGMAEQKDFGGSPAKALEAARSRAKGALAEAIKVRVSSQITENLQSKDGKVSEDIQSQTQSQAEVSIENIKFMEFTDFPEAGQMTVLATVSKEDYRRQLAGKAVRVYHLESGLRICAAMAQSPGLGDLTRSKTDEPGDALAGATVDFLWRDFYAGLQFGTIQGAKSSSGPSTSLVSAVTRYSAHLGYDWAPWSLRLQPFVPFQLAFSYWDMDPQLAQTFDASAGLGLRYWVNDSMAFQILGSYHQALSGGAVADKSGKALALPSGAQATVSGSGGEGSVGITWSGF
jgi:hypothetical protein